METGGSIIYGNSIYWMKIESVNISNNIDGVEQVILVK